ncbi:MAG: hypothetical protein C0631_02735 [Sedimenticola sp.]|nr:MAG: hypothetical protein C0631_02735 [Sedimenticola sp.]
MLRGCECHRVDYLVGIARNDRLAAQAKTFIDTAEHTAPGSSPRYLVTNLKAQPKYLYDQLYCARGEAENRIKELQLDWFADRTSCRSNQFRLLLSSLAYTLLEAHRRLGLDGTELANAYVGTICLKLLKIGAVITRNTRLSRHQQHAIHDVLHCR